MKVEGNYRIRRDQRRQERSTFIVFMIQFCKTELIDQAKRYECIWLTGLRSSSGT